MEGLRVTPLKARDGELCLLRGLSPGDCETLQVAGRGVPEMVSQPARRDGSPGARRGKASRDGAQPPDLPCGRRENREPERYLQTLEPVRVTWASGSRSR